MKHLIPVSVGFMALCLVACMIHNSITSVLMFAVSAALTAYLNYLDRSKITEIDLLRTEIQDLKRVVGNITVTMGFNG